MTLKRSGMFYRKRLSAHSLPDLWISPIAYRRYFPTKFKVLQRGNSGAPNREACSGLQELHPISEKPVRAFHVWSFCVGLLRQREIPPDGLPKSPAFTSVARLVNCIDLEPQEAKDLDSGAKPVHDSISPTKYQISREKDLIESLELDAGENC